jgi:hypothetical protein
MNFFGTCGGFRGQTATFATHTSARTGLRHENVQQYRYGSEPAEHSALNEIVNVSFHETRDTSNG